MKVYVSSTSKDLSEHRTRVSEFLRKSNYEVVAMEDYAATSKRPLQKCLDDVADCDVYVGIFAWRYGHIPRAGNSDHLSITEHEYRKAAELGKQICIFLLDSDVAWPPQFMDSHTGDGNSGARIKALRDGLQEHWTVSFFASPEQLATEVAAALHRAFLNFRERKLVERASTDRNTASALPAEPQHLEEPRPYSVRWLHKAIECSMRVGKVTDSSGFGVGSGFVVAGGDLDPRLGKELVFVTASYIVARDNLDALPVLAPEEATLQFEALGTTSTVTDVLWESRPFELSTIILRMADPPELASGLEIAPRCPLSGCDAFVLHHPAGGELSISFQDTKILDQDDETLHYRTPTVAGSGGGPVFNAFWRLIGIHHAGSTEMPRLHGVDGTYAANSGIKVTAIRAALAARG